MPMEEEPVVGAIYEDPEGQAFEVLSFNEDDGTIEIQLDDGTVDEIDIDAWYEMDLQRLKSAPWKDGDGEDVEEEEEDEDEDDAKRSPKKGSDDEDEDDDYDEDDEDE